MTTQIPVESLSVVSHSNVPVITTELLASLYSTNTDNIKKNYSRNQDRFVLGKHFFKLEGNELKEFKDRVTLSHLVAKHTRSLILWTERGAARHAKMLETDQAWEVFEKLEDCYFSQKQPVPARQSHPAIPFPKERRFIVTVSPDGTADTQPLPDDIFVGKVEQILNGLRKSGWIVIKRDLLAEKLATW
ncbi:ORF6N domain-containing protein [Escherichia coli]|uniref:ORF6N domain-containing protein n=1 Tax=Escherichia coli TaxID=562 RepID=UPI000BE8DC23|nr:ORF6N domain-containing protein [Escherichia coli]EFB9392243.1 ORF6N domain-containing protein [Escherichia coli]EHA7283055.1 ORF6N domain-containing protein [Salmonella enterica]ELM8902317.1 ORF6N domain-containing protein [Escherichia coli]